ncbi:FecR family protein [Hyphomicrobium sp. LHD-15]|uniref:FecR family protein n=1 Tax=Hyphomicrobium sp. LHD-15 TaxID=3072142 RepID=UPI00280C9C79|nr:FecR family protein [Hyphomicrobium sp. LHD-15]MDQ8697365.1 FecR family protein [Hyphomicrobium sp. LHD-15]
MNQDPFPQTDPDEAALAWLSRLRGNPAPGDQAVFEQWLAASPAHRVAWRRAESLWSTMGEPGARVAEEEASILAGYLENMDRARRRKAVRRTGTALGLALAVLSGAIWLEQPHLLQNLAADYVSARGERRLVTLSDASTVLLDADTAMDVAFSPGERRVRLLRGTAYFSVTKSGDPFIVEAADGQVRVLGTEFDVRLADQRAVVTLARGRVEVGNGTRTATIAPGQQVSYAADTLGTVVEADLDAALAWRDGRFVFYEARLADVVAEIARYRSGRIVITSSELANWTVSGSLPLDDPDAALRSLQSSVGFSMRSIAGRLVILH